MERAGGGCAESFLHGAGFQEMRVACSERFRQLCAQGTTLSITWPRDRDHHEDDEEDHAEGTQHPEEQPQDMEASTEEPLYSIEMPKKPTEAHIDEMVERLRPVELEGFYCDNVKAALNQVADPTGERVNRPNKRSIINCQFVLYDRDRKTVLETTHNKAQRLTSKKVLPGILLAMCYTPVGRQSCFLLPPELLFGELGVPPRIPPNAWGVLFLKVVDFIDASVTTEIFSMPAEMRSDFRHMKPKLEKMKSIANEFYNRGCYRDAEDAYEFTLTLFSKIDPDTLASEEAVSLLSRCYVNMALCMEKLNMPQNFLEKLDSALKLSGPGVDLAKIYYLKGMHFNNVGKYDDAFELLLKAQRLKPNNPEIGRLLYVVDQHVTENMKTVAEISKRAINAKPTLSEKEELAYKTFLDIVDFSKHPPEYIKLPGAYSSRDFTSLQRIAGKWNDEHTDKYKVEYVDSKISFRLTPGETEICK